MAYPRLVVYLLLLLVPVGLFAQGSAVSEGFEWGPVVVRPEASILEAYDNRVLLDRTTGDASSDFYSEVAGGVSLNNLPARYNLSARARYGYRFYSENTGLNDDFYNGAAAIASSQNPLKWGLSADVDKSLNYNTAYDPTTGTGPGSILVNTPNRRSIVRGNLSYDKQISEKVSIVPGLGAQHYYQEFQNSNTNAKWQIYNANVRLQQEYSVKTRFFVEGGASLQVNGDEEGAIAMVKVGAESKMTDKVSWNASVGFSAADYEISGSSQGGILDIRVAWQATEKVSAYVFAGNDYQPGYGGGGARMVYRAGYGVGWQPTPRWSLGGSVLHDYQDSVGRGSSISGTDEVRHFFTAQCGYRLAARLRLSLSGRYVNDEMDANQTVVALGLGYEY